MLVTVDFDRAGRLVRAVAVRNPPALLGYRSELESASNAAPPVRSYDTPDAEGAA
jgi:hypothetical protein